MCKAWQLAVWLWQDLPPRAPHLQGFGGKKGNITPVCAPSLRPVLNLLLSVLPSPNPFSTVTLKYPISLIFFFPHWILSSQSLWKCSAQNWTRLRRRRMERLYLIHCQLG